ncbi:MAG TPA: LysR family transcriptional regulator [Gemmatimonadaceae bacterium]
MSMNASRPELSELTAFATVAAHKSFRRAAEELGLSPSTLSHKMSALESRMGVRLLNRTTRSVAITQAGDALLGRLQPIFQQLDDALTKVDDFRAGPRGRLRINTNLSGARLLMEAVVPAFVRRYPQMQVDLIVDDRLVDIVAEGFDAGVRLEEAIPQDMIAVRFGGDTRFVAVASPRYLKDHAPPRSPTDLRKHSCIRFRTRSAKIYRWEFERRGQSYNIDVEGPLTLNDEDLMVQAATDGLGIAFVSERRAASAIKAGKLVVVLDDWCPRIAGLALYYPGHRQVPAGLRAFVEVLRRTGSERS